MSELLRSHESEGYEVCDDVTAVTGMTGKPIQAQYRICCHSRHTCHERMRKCPAGDFSPFGESQHRVCLDAGHSRRPAKRPVCGALPHTR